MDTGHGTAANKFTQKPEILCNKGRGLEFKTEVYIDKKPASHAFAGERKTMTEADVMAMVNAGEVPGSGDGK